MENSSRIPGDISSQHLLTICFWGDITNYGGVRKEAFLECQQTGEDHVDVEERLRAMERMESDDSDDSDEEEESFLLRNWVSRWWEEGEAEN